MTPDQDERIRQRAHEIWEREGRPHGRHDDHWQQARDEIEAEALQMESMKGVSSDPALDAPAPAPSRRGRAAKPPAALAGADGEPAPSKRRNPRKPAEATPPEDAPAPARRRSAKAATASDEQVAAHGSVQAGAPKGRRRKPAAGGTEPEGAPSA